MKFGLLKNLRIPAPEYTPPLLSRMVILLMAGLFIPLVCACADEGNDRALRFDSQPASALGFCFVFGGTAASEDFFRGLRKFETPTGVEFRKGSQSLKYFPQNLTIAINAIGLTCSENSSGKRKTETEPTIEIMNSFELSMYWKQGARLNRVREASSQDLTVMDIPDLMQSPRKVWIYTVSICDEEIPLESHLIAVISSSQGRTVARLSARIR